MGQILSTVFVNIFGKETVRIALIGLDDAGKTTVLYNLLTGEEVTTAPTLGFNVETIECKNVVFTIWDFGGQEAVRPLWKHYFQKTKGLIFVVDSANTKRMQEVKTELERILNDFEIKNAPLLIFSNKQDLPNAMTPKQLEKDLALRHLLGMRRKWRVQGACAITGEGLQEGLDWMSKQLSWF